MHSGINCCQLFHTMLLMTKKKRRAALSGGLLTAAATATRRRLFASCAKTGAGGGAQAATSFLPAAPWYKPHHRYKGDRHHRTPNYRGDRHHRTRRGGCSYNRGCIFNERAHARATAKGGAATAEKPTDKKAAPTAAEAATRAKQSGGDKPTRRQQPDRAHGRACAGRAGTL